MALLVYIIVFPLEYYSASGGDSIGDEEKEEGAEEEEQEEGIQNDDTEEEKDAHYASEVRNMASLKPLYPKRKIKNLNIPANQHNKTISHILCQKAHSILKQNIIDHTSTERCLSKYHPCQRNEEH
ncbi:hypothetical protein RMATCC62417_00224 [Rhizopus microsporus]|nr:hypothetical protein RMATCC62417_00224 [Rhizopus microsporus]